MMIKEFNQLTQQKYIHMEQTKIQYLVSENEDIKCNNIIKQYKND